MFAVNLTRARIWGFGLSFVAACSGDPAQPDDSDSTDTTSAVAPTSGQGSLNSTTASTQSVSTQTTQTSGNGSNDATTQGSPTFEVELLQGDLTYPCTLRDGGDVIYTCDRRQYLGQPSRILALPKGGGAPTTVVEVERADGVAINDSLWVLNSADNLLSRFVLETGEAKGTLQVPYYTSTLFSTALGVLGASTEGVGWYATEADYGQSLWASGGFEEVWLMATTASSIYFTVNPPYPADPGSTYRVMQLNVDLNAGTAVGAPLELTSGTGAARGIAVTAGAVIFADGENNKVYSVPLSGGTKTVLADVPSPWSVGVNSTHAYIASRPDPCPAVGGIYRVPLGGGALETISDQQVCPSNVLVSDEAVYWLNAGPEQPSGEPVMVSGSYATIMRVKL